MNRRRLARLEREKVAHTLRGPAEVWAARERCGKAALDHVKAMLEAHARGEAIGDRPPLTQQEQADRDLCQQWDTDATGAREELVRRLDILARRLATPNSSENTLNALPRITRA